MTLRIETSPKRVRTFLDGTAVADSTNVQMVWEKPYYPTYFFPISDVADGALKPSADGDRFDVHVNGTVAEGAARSLPDHDELVTFSWRAMEAWFEEDEQVYVHPRDPNTRVDILPSSREIVVEIDGTEVARTTNARFLFETGLPARYYIPKTDVAMDRLTDTDLHTECPYKGVASYYSVNLDSVVHENIAWWYPYPVRESAEVAGMICFYNEKVDVFIDGELQERPRTHF